MNGIAATTAMEMDDGKEASHTKDDGHVRLECINTPDLVEFYLLSHHTPHGTAIPTKYTLIYDQIGWKLTELELFTYWTTFLSCRCTKSVSIATPGNSRFLSHFLLSLHLICLFSLLRKVGSRTRKSIVGSWRE